MACSIPSIPAFALAFVWIIGMPNALYNLKVSTFITLVLSNIFHIEYKGHRQTQIHDLRHQKQPTFQVGDINNSNYGIGLSFLSKAV